MRTDNLCLPLARGRHLEENHTMQWLTSICITLTLASLTHTASAGVVLGSVRKPKKYDFL